VKDIETPGANDCRVCRRQKFRMIKHGPNVQVGHVKKPAVDVVLEILERAPQLKLSQFLAMPLQPERIFDLDRVQWSKKKWRLGSPDKG
jgi:hypothetical protein